MTTTPTGPQATGGSRFSIGGQVTDLGYAAGWRVVRAMPELVARNAFDAGAIYASRNGGPAQLRKNLGARARCAARQSAGRADPCFAGLLRPILAGGVPVAVDGQREAARAHRAVPARQRTRPGRSRRRARRDNAAAAQRELGHGRGVDGPAFRHASPPSPSGSSRNRCIKRFIDYRESLGFEMLPLTGGERPPFEVLSSACATTGSSP